MNSVLRFIPLLCVLVASLTLGACQSAEEPMGEEGAMAAQEYERGPNNGRLLRDGNFSLELQIFEDGVPPEYHVYLYRESKLIAPNEARVVVQLTRLDGEVNRFDFTPEGNYLRGSGEVTEPHSFSVAVTAEEGGRTHEWGFDSFEGRVTIAAAKADASGIRTEKAGAAVIKDAMKVTGRVVANAERVRSVSARFPGAIREVTASIGDSVRVGQRLATIESNESLETYALTAPIAGVITERRANPGENAGSEPLFVITDYSNLWAELNLFPRDLPRVKVGQRVALKSVDGSLEGQGQIVRLAPSENVQRGIAGGVYTARVELKNEERRWAPGLFVEGAIEVAEASVPLAVKRSGLQGFRDFTVVFAQVGETYEVRMLELGRMDAQWAEVLGGLKPGTTYVSENSYLIKADIEKSGASHDH